MTERLIELRNSKGLTQEGLSKVLQKEGLGYFDRATISRIETGQTTRVNMEYIRAVSTFYDVTADYILGATDTPDKKNYEIAELGLSYAAARKLIRREVNPDALNLLLECEEATALCEMIPAYFSPTMREPYGELAGLFPEIRGLADPVKDYDLQLSDIEKRRVEADLSILQDPLELQKGMVLKQFSLVVEEMIESMFADSEPPEVLRADNNERMRQLRLEIEQKKRQAGRSTLTEDEKAEIICRIAARRMQLHDDEAALLLELFKCMLRHRTEVEDERLRRAQ